jgi:hypothetical protein
MFSANIKCKENHNIKTGNRSFEDVTQLKYLETKKNESKFEYWEINGRLNSGNARYHSTQKISPAV